MNFLQSNVIGSEHSFEQSAFKASPFNPQFQSPRQGSELDDKLPQLVESVKKGAKRNTLQNKLVSKQDQIIQE